MATENKAKDKISSIRVRDSTKELLKSFGFARKGVSYERIIRLLIQKVKNSK